MTTIKDIARIAHVSVGTVSNYLNNPSLLSSATYELLNKTIKELGYHPDSAAQSLKTKQTKRIGIIPVISIADNTFTPTQDTAFYNLLSAINTEASKSGYGILLQAATNKEDEIKFYQRMIGEKQVDGFILMGISRNDERIDLLLKKGMPFIAFGRTSSTTRYSYIDIDGEKGILNAVNYLAKKGHQRIAFVKPPSELTFSQHRFEGYKTGLERNNLQLEDDLLCEGGFSEQSGRAVMDILMQRKHPPTAILAPNDYSAFGMLNWLSTHGLTPGKQVAIIGFDDISLASHWHPSLTTVSQPFFKIGIQLTQLLLKKVTGKTKEFQILLEPELIIRETA